jgi:hypothetical protein
MWFMLFIKQFPVIAITEIKEIVKPRLKHRYDKGVDIAAKPLPFMPDTPGEFD